MLLLAMREGEAPSLNKITESSLPLKMDSTHIRGYIILYCIK